MQELDRWQAMKKESLRNLKAAAKRGEVHAQLELAARLATADGIERNETEAARWYGVAANQGSKDAAFNLATMYERGEGVKRNERRANALYKKAAKLGSADANIVLGTKVLSVDHPSRENVVEAIEQFATAAINHDSRGILLIAAAVIEHPTVEKVDIVTALLSASHKCGSRDARKLLRGLRGKR